MLKFVSCIAVEHDALFTLAALGLCAAGSLVFSNLASRSADRRGTVHVALVLLSGLVGGATIWTAHFVAMLGYRTDLVTGYDLPITLGSLLIAVVTTTIGTAIATSQTQKPTIRLGGVVVGSGIPLMHYAGVMAMNVQGTISWDPPTVIASLVSAIGFAVLAITAVRRTRRFHTIHAAGALVLAITSMHFIGMSAMVITPAPVASLLEGISNETLALGIAGVVGTVIALGGTTWIVDHFNNRDMREGYRYLSLHDPLTSLPNREHLKFLLEGMLAQPGRAEPRAAVAVLELGHFREVNEVHGRQAGDRILQGLAQRISASLQPGEHLGRFDGVSFVAMREVGSREEAVEFGNRLLATARRPIHFDHAREFEVGIGLGLATCPEDGSNADDLLDRAYFAADQANEKGANQLCAFQAEVEEQRRLRAALAIDLRGAASRGEFELLYQQQNSTTSEEITGFEALLRWNHPYRGQVSPALFIPLAERLGIVDAVGEWALLAACNDASTWPVPLRIAVNVAPAQLTDPNFPATVRRILSTSGLDPRRLELEVTETGILGDRHQARDSIVELKGMGISVAMDDYGTGYSSLSMLQKFPFDKIKIDKEFISGVAINSHSAAIVLATIALGKGMHIPVLAEGVETDEQLAFLKGAGCDQVQGFLFGRPMRIDAVVRTLQDQMQTISRALSGNREPDVKLVA